ncbi:malto-oligosyltrehalose trehalohydrolase [Steroidobacter sp.]|uniref:malto-oligosyltrehalose trehalohydrolase n=1 Tax=Steroidobacter sp. TaxID=1978227 RepID=UPI001A3E66B2|nr:malto-oligosyltrehalose trehalohydrolase [Steroidobacter sp.]MBL8267748.1 malto-oligosyltrehalose trehalohydrolase [Steroidobacter sp.]
MSNDFSLQFGPQLTAEGTKFRLWAPSARRVDLIVGHEGGGPLRQPLTAGDDGWFETLAHSVGPGTRYRFRIDDELEVPDPASRFQPDGVTGPSQVVDRRSFPWRRSDWHGREWHETVLYELHIGTFTQAGTYAAAIDRLDDLASIGITAIELLPLNTFPGRWGWGYDGVLLYAPHPTYGRPEELKRFVQAAHDRGLMVLLDVVYNHFGPEGNYLHRYAEDFFTSARHTPWGSAINFAHPIVRQFFIQNALYWLAEYRFDGLRVDAVHAMFDDGDTHFIDELVETVQRGPGSERSIHIVLENHHNEARRLGCKGRTMVAQWDDDAHHALHVALSDERDGYYANYADRPLEHLGRVLAEGFAYQGEVFPAENQPRGEPSSHLTPSAFVSFLQNHDQIGNRALGERLTQLTPPERLRAGFAILLLSPQIPMLFMGEEYGAVQPFLYFCDYQGDLAKAIREGRRNEFAAFGSFTSDKQREQIPDPNAPETYRASQLNAADRTRSPHREWEQLTRDLLSMRTKQVVPLIPGIQPGAATYSVDEHLLTVKWPITGGKVLVLQANLSDTPKSALLSGEVWYSTASAGARGETLGAWEVRWSLDQP